MKSSFCSFGDCVDVEFEGGWVVVRNSGEVDPPLRFTHEEWSVFLAGVRAGEFNVPDGG